MVVIQRLTHNIAILREEAKLFYCAERENRACYLDAWLDNYKITEIKRRS